MAEIKILEIIVCVMIIANVLAFGILFGRVNFLMAEFQMWFEDWIRERKNDAGIYH